MQQSPYIPLRIIQIRKDTSNTKSFILKQMHGPAIKYKPGQFLTLVFKKPNAEERRSYSISSTPFLNEPLTITVKRIDNGEYSRYLFDVAQVGDVLVTIGASGYFTLPENLTNYPQTFFLAAGSGITPILPLIKTVLYNSPAVHVTLIYSNRRKEDSIFLNELQFLSKEFPNQFNLELLFSVSQNLLKARLTKFVLLQFIQKNVTQKYQTLFYICGPFDYMQMATITLLTEGIPLENIRKENFSTEKPVIKELPPDIKPHHVQVNFSGKQYHLTVQYPTTILEAAKRERIMLPYSCEVGKCGTCSATCLKGNVWHAYNEVLMDRELEKGRILTCTGYPYGDEDIIIHFPEATEDSR
ncbi:ferredoxin--NADP reductase [Chryseolinea sp. H1M3-3]|uniref:ferredoxin--NADP reductase n=1 Tax=Chryseolinea sp. H1M3-3 TaxID=3034144 RepID=UPI0023ED2BF0|nr:ferredoxin--NADP reductase [Chryseolinea sp. H1M3-3]